MNKPSLTKPGLCLSQPVCGIFNIKYPALRRAAHAIIFQHTGIDSCILTLDLKCWRWCYGVQNVVIIAVGTVLVTQDTCQQYVTVAEAAF